MEPVGKLKLFWRFTGWLALIFVLPAVILTLISVFEARKANRLEDAGGQTQATILEKDVRVTTDSDGDRRTSYYLTFRFDHERQEVTDTDSVSRSFFNSLEVGDTTLIRYWLEDPMVNEIRPGSSGTAALITKILAVVFWVIAGIWGERSWLKASRAVKVREKGERRSAEVIEHVRTNVTVNKRRMYRLKWRDEAGAEGQSMWVSGHDLDSYPEGAELAVFADPRGKWPAMWERDVGRAKGAVERG